MISFKISSKHDVKVGNRLGFNIICSSVAFLSSSLISFLLSPYIVKNLGVEANGYILLANNFVNYATIITLALNSMAARFISIAIHRGNIERANKYFTSLFVGNMATVVFLLIPVNYFFINLDSIINVSTPLIWDVKLTFAITFINFFIATAVPNWTCIPFVINTLYLNSFRDMQGNVLRLVLILALFTFFIPHIYFISIVAVLITIYKTIYSYYYKNILLPELRIKREYFDIETAWELIKSGIWNTVSRIGTALQSGLDLLITNLFIGPKEMGVLALAKIIAGFIDNLANNITTVFTPSLTINYAKGDILAIKKELIFGMKVMGIIITIPVSILIILGKEFYSLWVPSQDAQTLQIVSILTCSTLIFTGATRCLYNVFTVTNRLKPKAILVFLSGIISTLIVFVLLKTTDLGIYAVAAVSSFFMIIFDLLYTVPYSAKYLGLKWHTFYPNIVYSLLSVFILNVVGFIIKHFISIHTWLMLGEVGCLIVILGFGINLFIVLNKEERKKFIDIINAKLKIRK